MRKVFGWILLLLTVAWGVPLAVAGPWYHLHDLGPHIVTGISSDGNVQCGSVIATNQAAAFLYPDGTVELLGTLPGGATSEANGCNNFRQVVGTSNTGPFGLETHGFWWAAMNGGMLDFGALPGAAIKFSAATAVNDFGIVAGYATKATLNTVPVFWVWGEPYELPTLGGEQGFAEDLNDHPTIVGQSTTTTGVHHATLWYPDGDAIDLHPPGEAGTSVATGINHVDAVVGLIQVRGVDRGFVWSWDKGFRRLAPLPGDDTSRAADVNNSGRIVGNSRSPEVSGSIPVFKAVVWIDEVPYDLNVRLKPHNLGAVQLRSAQGIANDGKIIVQGRLPGSTARRAFLLIPAH